MGGNHPTHAAPVSMKVGPITLLVLQPTPFCNLDCRYCYLPNRSSRKRMGRDVLEAVFRAVLGSRFCRDNLTIAWHAGEPLVLPVRFYEDAIALFESLNHAEIRVRHNIQTNGVLVNEEWCTFFLRHGIKVGLSLDGPAFLHDTARVRRNGRGTHADAMRAVHLMREAGIGFEVIAVVTRDTLAHPEAFVEFFLSKGIASIALNIEEVEGVHTASSLAYAEAADDFRRFLSIVYKMVRATGTLRVRELSAMERCLLGGAPVVATMYLPFNNVTVDCDGNFTVFAPELLGATHPLYGPLIFGNILKDGLESVADSELFRTVYAEMLEGLRMCKQGCPYYSVCGGNSPSNKLFENSTFASTETMDCRLNRQLVAEVVLEELERTHGVAGSG
jgi:uncharacterized protein